MPPATYPSPKVQAFAWWRSRPLPKGGERVGRVRTRTAAGSRTKRAPIRGDGRRAPCAYGWRGTRSRLQHVYASLLACRLSLGKPHSVLA